MRTILLLGLAALFFVSCGRPDSSSRSGASREPAETFESPEEERYTRAGRPFADAVFKRDFAAAYEMLSSHVKARTTLADFEAEHAKTQAEFFVPAAADPAYVVEMDLAVLSGKPQPGADKTDQAIDMLSFQRYVGAVPSDIPADIRRASLAAPFYDKPAAGDDIDARCCYLTYLLVEDQGQLKVAHYFYRWHDMLD